MHKHLQNLKTWLKAQLWITEGQSLEPKNHTVVYYHSFGLRVRYCKPAVYPLAYDKNANSRPNYKCAENFNKWALDLKEALLPAEIIMENRLNEAKKLLKIAQ
jgi:hypothetical protein